MKNTLIGTRLAWRHGFAATAILGVSIVLALPGCFGSGHAYQPVRSPYAPVPLKPLELRDAVGMALKYNMDVALKSRKEQLQKEMATATKLGLFPSMTGKLERSRSDEYRASSSRSLDTGRESLEPSYSSEKRSNTYDLTLAWNLLDFGLTSIRGRQGDFQWKIEEQRYRRAVQTLVLQVTEAYWKAVVAQEALDEAEQLIKLADQRRAHLQKAQKEKTMSSLAALEAERKLVMLQMQLKDFHKTYQSARIELARLVGLMPGTKFILAPMRVPSALAPMAKLSMRQLEEEALRNRPELAEEQYQEKIQRDEVRASFLKMMPNAQIFGTRNFDYNRFLVNQQWWTAGVTASWNILQLPKLYQEAQINKMKVDVLRERRLAVAVGVIAQVHLAKVNLEDAIREWNMVSDLANIQNGILTAAQKRFERGQVDDNLVFDKQADAFLGRIRYLTSFAEYMTARQRLYNSLGRDSVDTPDQVMAANK